MQHVAETSRYKPPLPMSSDLVCVLQVQQHSEGLSSDVVVTSPALDSAHLMGSANAIEERPSPLEAQATARTSNGQVPEAIISSAAAGQASAGRQLPGCQDKYQPAPSATQLDSSLIQQQAEDNRHDLPDRYPCESVMPVLMTDKAAADTSNTQNSSLAVDSQHCMAPVPELQQGATAEAESEVNQATASVEAGLAEEGCGLAVWKHDGLEAQQHCQELEQQLR